MFSSDYKSIDDEVLIAEALAGNKRSLEMLVKRHQDFIYNISLKLFLDPSDALDATQEILIKVVTSLKTFKGESQFRTWLYRIAVNHFLNTSQKKNERIYLGTASGAVANIVQESQEEITEAEIEEVRLLCSTAMLMCLNREQRLLYIIGEVFGADHQLGAELFETTPANYRVKLHRAKADLVNFVSGKCGLIDPRNSCRCHKKAKVMVAQGTVDKNKMLFNVDYEKKIRAVVAINKNQVSDAIQLKIQELFQDSPFQIKEELNTLLDQMIK